MISKNQYSFQKTVYETSIGKTVTKDISEQVNQIITVSKIKADICGIVTDISRMDKAIEDQQHHNNKRFDRIESDIGSIKKMTKTLTEDNSKILRILQNLSKDINPKEAKRKSSTTKTSSTSSQKGKEK